ALPELTHGGAELSVHLTHEVGPQDGCGRRAGRGQPHEQQDRDDGDEPGAERDAAPFGVQVTERMVRDGRFTQRWRVSERLALTGVRQLAGCLPLTGPR